MSTKTSAPDLSHLFGGDEDEDTDLVADDAYLAPQEAHTSPPAASQDSQRTRIAPSAAVRPPRVGVPLSPEMAARVRRAAYDLGGPRETSAAMQVALDALLALLEGLTPDEIAARAAEWRRIPLGERRTVRTYQVNDDQIKRLEALGRDHGIEVATVLRAAIATM